MVQLQHMHAAKAPGAQGPEELRYYAHTMVVKQAAAGAKGVAKSHALLWRGA